MEWPEPCTPHLLKAVCLYTHIFSNLLAFVSSQHNICRSFQSSCFYRHLRKEYAKNQDVSLRLCCTVAISSHWMTVPLTVLLFISFCYHLQSPQAVLSDLPARLAGRCSSSQAPAKSDLSPLSCCCNFCCYILVHWLDSYHWRHMLQYLVKLYILEKCHLEMLRWYLKVIAEVPV